MKVGHGRISPEDDPRTTCIPTHPVNKVRRKYMNVVTPEDGRIHHVNPLQKIFQIRRVLVGLFIGRKIVLDAVYWQRKCQRRQNKLAPRCRHRGTDPASGRCLCAGRLRIIDRAAYVIKMFVFYVSLFRTSFLVGAAPYG